MTGLCILTRFLMTDHHVARPSWWPRYQLPLLCHRFHRPPPPALNSSSTQACCFEYFLVLLSQERGHLWKQHIIFHEVKQFVNRCQHYRYDQTPSYLQKDFSVSMDKEYFVHKPTSRGRTLKTLTKVIILIFIAFLSSTTTLISTRFDFDPYARCRKPILA